MTHPIRGFAALLAALVLAFAAPADATVVRYLTLDEHIALSHLVVRGRAVEQRSYVDSKDGRPRTETTFEVIETFKGAPAATVKVRQMRGPVGEGVLAIAGDPEFRVGDELVLFLVTDASGTAFLTALAQSSYGIHPGDPGPVVDRNLADLAMQLPEGGVGEAPAEAAVPLELFRATVRELAREVR